MKFAIFFYRKYIPSLIFLVLILGSARSNSQNASSGSTTIVGATIIDGTGEKIENGVVIISNGRIEAVGDTTIDIPANSEILDFSGNILLSASVKRMYIFGSTGFPG